MVGSLICLHCGGGAHQRARVRQPFHPCSFKSSPSFQPSQDAHDYRADLLPLFPLRRHGPTIADQAVNGQTKKANELIDLANTIAYRAGWFLRLNHDGGSKYKTIAQALSISPGMAKLLCAGRSWTVERVDQAMLRWPGFQAFVFPQSDNLHDQIILVLKELADLRERIDRINDSLGEKR